MYALAYLKSLSAHFAYRRNSGGYLKSNRLLFHSSGSADDSLSIPAFFPPSPHFSRLDSGVVDRYSTRRFETTLLYNEIRDSRRRVLISKPFERIRVWVRFECRPENESFDSRDASVVAESVFSLPVWLHCGACPALQTADRIHENWSIEILRRLGCSLGCESTLETYCLRETDSFRLVACLDAASI